MWQRYSEFLIKVGFLAEYWIRYALLHPDIHSESPRNSTERKTKAKSLDLGRGNQSIWSNFQEISENFTIFLNRRSSILSGTPPRYFWTKRPRIRAFHREIWRSWKFEQKILSLEKVRSSGKIKIPNLSHLGRRPLSKLYITQLMGTGVRCH